MKPLTETDISELRRVAGVLADEHIADFIYSVRESEGLGWDGARVVAWSNAATVIERLRKEGKV